MARVGWGFLLFLLLLGAAFAAMVRVVPPGERTAAPAALPTPQSVPAVPAAAPAPQPLAAPTPAPAPLPPGAALVVPVAGVARSVLRSNWGDPRDGGTRAHQGLDIMAPGGTPVLAAADGTVEKLYLSQGGGGITLYERSPDRRWLYYYAHLAGYAPGIAEGAAVRAGQTIAYVGDTGNAGTGNFHLHFGVSVLEPAQRWHEGRAIDPYPLLAGNGDGG